MIIFGGALRGGRRSSLLGGAGVGRHPKWTWGVNESSAYFGGDFIVRLSACSWRPDRRERQGTLTAHYGKPLPGSMVDYTGRLQREFMDRAR